MRRKGKNIQRERFWMKEENSLFPNGANMRDDISKFVSEPVKINISDGTRGRIVSEEGRKNMSESQRGNKRWCYGMKTKNPTSLFYGVSRNNKKNGCIYSVSTKLNGKTMNIGNFKNEIYAALAYNQYVSENKLSNPPNFIEEEEDGKR